VFYKTKTMKTFLTATKLQKYENIKGCARLSSKTKDGIEEWFNNQKANIVHIARGSVDLLGPQTDEFH
jgi:hypothetical protein